MSHPKFSRHPVLVLFVLIYLICVSSSQLVFRKGAPHLKLEHEKYIGLVKNSRADRPYYEFLGLRYANPPKRFQPPEPYTGSDSSKPEVKHAMKAAPRCPQKFGANVIGEEDCLFLNVFVPMRSPPEKDGFPVMVWIHGGAFAFSSGDSYEPQYFMDEDIIMITINYRLGAFGFLSTEDEIVPGNMGLKDQVLALKWVQQHIKNFGGDNKRVTIFGSSAGAASVHYLMLSPMGKGLFHNAIAQSGSAHSFWAVNHNPTSTAQELAQLAGCSSETTKEIVACLETKSTEEIINAQAKIKRWYIDPITPFGPTVELYQTESTFLADFPENIIESREFSRVPLMLGVNQDEGLSLNSAGVIHNEKLRLQLDGDFETLAPITFNYKNWFPSENLKDVTQEIRKFYFGSKQINLDSFQNLTNLYSDVNFVYGVWKLALEHATEKPVYPYVLSFQDESSSSITKLFTGLDKIYGVAHGDEIQYLFKSLFFANEVPKDSESEIFSKRLVRLWASFATHRKPTETWGTATKWPPISKAQLQGDKPVKWYQLDKDTKIIEEPFLDRKKFWDKLFKKYSTYSYKDEL